MCELKCVTVGKGLCETEWSVKDNHAQRNINPTRGYFTDSTGTNQL